jgi:hypothetical protein
MAHDLRADLDQLVFKPVGDQSLIGSGARRQRAQEVAEVVGECMKLEPHCVGCKCPA